MKCENIQFNLPLYADADDILTDAERAAVAAHLEICPMCRVLLAEFQSIGDDLRRSATAARAEMSADALWSVRNAVAVELNRTRHNRPEPFFSASRREWLQYRLMPYAVGTVASVALTIALLLTLLSTREATQRGVEYAQVNANRAVVVNVAGGSSSPGFGQDGSANDDYSSTLSLPIALESPRINPTGALMALTKSIVRGKLKDEDVTVVADVFGDGIAQIAEVVEAPRDRRAMQDLERALREDESFAPFVPAAQDNRSDRVRVILKIQRVDVVDKKPSSSRPKSKSRSL